MKIKVASVLLACTCWLGVAAAPAQAASTTFAQFLQLVKSDRVFKYTDFGALSTLTAGGVQPQVSFSPSLVPPINFIGLLDPENTLVTLNATATGAVSLTNVFGLNVFTQPFDGSLTFTINPPKVGPGGPSTNVLTVTFQNALFFGANGTSSPTLTADEVVLGSTITYSSGFANLAGLTNKNFSLSFSGANDPFTYALSRLPTRDMSGTGTFAAAVPEPSTWAFMVFGVGAVGLSLRMRKGRVAFS